MPDETGFETIAEKLRRENDANPKVVRPQLVNDDPLWITPDKLPIKEDAIDINAPLVDESCTVSVALKPREGVRAKRFLDMIENGMSPGEAVEKIGTTVKELVKTPEMKAELKKLIDANTLPANLTKAMVRAGWNKMFMENINGNLKQQKMALAVSKEVAKDPDIGLANAPSLQIGVGVDMGTLGKKLETIQPLPGLEEFIEESNDKED